MTTNQDSDIASLVASLRKLAYYAHHDVSIAEEAADLIESLRAPDYSAYDIRNMAHAKLLTAAPDLLAACEELIESVGFLNASEFAVPRSVVARITAAIANAKGESQ